MIENRATRNFEKAVLHFSLLDYKTTLLFYDTFKTDFRESQYSTVSTYNKQNQIYAIL